MDFNNNLYYVSSTSSKYPVYHSYEELPPNAKKVYDTLKYMQGQFEFTDGRYIIASNQEIADMSDLRNKSMVSMYLGILHASKFIRLTYAYDPYTNTKSHRIELIIR